MKFGLYCIKDNVSGDFGNIIQLKNNDVAIRYFGLTCEKSPIAKDLVLVKVAIFDSETGCLGDCGNEVVCKGVDFVKYEEK